MGQKNSKNKNKANPKETVSNDTSPPSKKKSDKEVKKNASNNDHYKTKHDEAIKYGLEVMRSGFVKVDHFAKIYRLTPKYEGAPNLRQVKGFEVYGTGQPHKSTILSLLDVWFNQQKLTKCLWINMRSEPVIYVEDISLAPRDPKHPSENVHIGEEGIITIEDLNLFNEELEKVVKTNIESNNNVFVYHKDTYAPLPADREDMTLEMECKNGGNDVYGLESLYKSFKDDNNYNVKLQRITVLDEKAPDPTDIVKITNTITKESDDKTVIIFNCQMGKGRTTEGMIMACLIQLVTKKKKEISGNVEQDEQKEADNKDCAWPNDIPSEAEEETSFNKKLAEQGVSSSDEEKGGLIDDNGLSEDQMRNGNFTLINNLIKILTNEYKLNGENIKKETDDIINKCQHLTNMRECIFLAKRRYFAEKREEQRGYWIKMSKQFLERYYVLIVYNAYLNDVLIKQNKGCDDIDYISWIKEKELITSNIGNIKDGALSEFNWD